MRGGIKRFLKIFVPPGANKRFDRLKTQLIDAVWGVPARRRLAGIRAHAFQINIASRDRRVVFVSEAPTQREAKLSYGLKRAGWDVIQLYQRKTPLTDFSHVSEALQFHNTWEAVDLAHRAKSRLFHNFSWAGDATSVRLLKNKPGRVIFDFYDYYFSIVDGLPEQEKARRWEIERQSHCIEMADALCCRDLQLQYRRKENRRGRGKPLILFPEYCWDREPLPTESGNGETHIVQIGTMGMETWGQIASGSYQVFERFVDAGCHLHIYLHPYFPKPDTRAFREIFHDYLKLGRRTGRVHLYPPVSPSHLVGEIKQYDFGGSVNNGLTFDIPWTDNNRARLPYCGSSRLFDYLDAGLSLILHRQSKFMNRTYQGYGVAFDATDLLQSPDLRAALANKPKREAFLKARAALSIDANIGRLVKFYENLR